MKGEESRMITRSRSRASGAKSVRIRSPSEDRLEPEPPVLTREKLFDEPSADIPQQGSKAKMRWSWICKHCGKWTKDKFFGNINLFHALFQAKNTFAKISMALIRRNARHQPRRFRLWKRRRRRRRLAPNRTILVVLNVSAVIKSLTAHQNTNTTSALCGRVDGLYQVARRWSQLLEL